MIHVGALPGTPAGALGLAQIEKQALREKLRTPSSSCEGMP